MRDTMTQLDALIDLLVGQPWLLTHRGDEITTPALSESGADALRIIRDLWPRISGAVRTAERFHSGLASYAQLGDAIHALRIRTNEWAAISEKETGNGE